MRLPSPRTFRATCRDRMLIRSRSLEDSSSGIFIWIKRHSPLESTPRRKNLQLVSSFSLRTVTERYSTVMRIDRKTFAEATSLEPRQILHLTEAIGDTKITTPSTKSADPVGRVGSLVRFPTDICPSFWQPICITRRASWCISWRWPVSLFTRLPASGARRRSHRAHDQRDGKGRSEGCSPNA